MTSIWNYIKGPSVYENDQNYIKLLRLYCNLCINDYVKAVSNLENSSYKIILGYNQYLMYYLDIDFYY